MKPSKVTFSIYLPTDKRRDLSPIFNVIRQYPSLTVSSVITASLYGYTRVDIVSDIYAGALRDYEKENVKKAINAIVSLMLEMP